MKIIIISSDSINIVLFIDDNIGDVIVQDVIGASCNCPYPVAHAVVLGDEIIHSIIGCACNNAGTDIEIRFCKTSGCVNVTLFVQFYIEDVGQFIFLNIVEAMPVKFLRRDCTLNGEEKTEKEGDPKISCSHKGP